MTQLYHYQPATGIFERATVATPNPLEADAPLVPRYATTLAPPAIPAGSAAVWRDGQWNLVPDLRGTTYWLPDGRAVQIDAVDIVLPDGAVLIAPPAPGMRWRPAVDGIPGAWVVPPKYPTKDAAVAAIVAAIEAFEARAVGRRSQGERDSWPDQEAAARVILAGGDDHVGLSIIDSIRARTGEERTDIATRIVAAADLFRAMIGPLVGYRSAFVAAIDAADTLEDVEVVTDDGLQQIAAYAASQNLEGDPQ